MLDKQISDFALVYALLEEEGDLADEMVVVKLPGKQKDGEQVTTNGLSRFRNILCRSNPRLVNQAQGDEGSG